MLEDIESAVVDGDDLKGKWREYDILYRNGVVKGNEPLLDSVDNYELHNIETGTKREEAEVRGNLFYQIIKQLNDVDEHEMRLLATEKNLKEVVAVWSEL
jgi:hypothetical protein